MNKPGEKRSDVIREARLRKGYTQMEAAAKAEITLRTYQRLEHGERDISSASMKTGIGVCAALGLDPTTLILGGELQIDS